MKQYMQIAALLVALVVASACGKKEEQKPPLVKQGLAAAMKATGDKPNYENKSPTSVAEEVDVPAQAVAGADGKPSPNRAGQAGETGLRK